MSLMKPCVVCKQEKDLDCFFNSKQSKDGKSYRCKECDAVARKDSRSRSAATREGYRRRAMALKYGITVAEYEDMFERQDNKCAICGTTNPAGEGNELRGKMTNLSFSVDHCHDTGQVRGLLCNTCNRGLGFFRDRVDLLQGALSYLSQHKSQ